MVVTDTVLIIQNLPNQTEPLEDLEVAVVVIRQLKLLAATETNHQFHHHKEIPAVMVLMVLVLIQAVVEEALAVLATTHTVVAGRHQLPLLEEMVVMDLHQSMQKDLGIQ